MEPGFVIDPEAMQTFKDHVGQIVTAYDAINNEIKFADLEANPGAKQSLLCDPVHHLGPPDAFANSCETLLDSYGQMLQRFRTAFEATARQVNHIVQALGETQALYAEIDDRQANIFNDLLKSFDSGHGGGDHGTTR